MMIKRAHGKIVEKTNNLNDGSESMQNVAHLLAQDDDELNPAEVAVSEAVGELLEVKESDVE
jgi:hypothetical protein